MRPTIRDARLYRETHGTFEDYCGERWGFSRQRGYQLIEASQIVGAMSTTVDIPNEAVARELAPLRDDPEQMREAYREARADSPDREPTAALVREKMGVDPLLLAP